ncbi:MAG: alkane 1-monooxygenase [Nannocystaceae bacterium]|nr:alkane 1-monooxygenase [bacterium]
MVRSLPYWIVYVVPAVAVLGLWHGGVGTLAALVFVFGVIPVLERVMGMRTDNDGTGGPTRSIAHDMPLYVWVPTQLGVQLYGLWLITSGHLAGWESVVGTVSIGVMAAAGGINIAHELMHRKDPKERALAEVLMGSVTYSHFCVEHVYGHHRHVATRLDPASSRYGESVYAFLPRTILGGVFSAWGIEQLRARKQGIPLSSLRHRMTRYGLTQVLVYATLAITLGPIAVAYWAGQSFVAIAMLEVINYVEHYGLSRCEISPGRYERVQPHHSWNASHRLTNWLLFNLQRHSDHHYLASRPYHMLRHYDDVPQLPAGYATMILTALVPPLWRRVMHPRVNAWRRRTTLGTPSPASEAA